MQICLLFIHRALHPQPWKREQTNSIRRRVVDLPLSCFFALMPFSLTPLRRERLPKSCFSIGVLSAAAVKKRHVESRKAGNPTTTTSLSIFVLRTKTEDRLQEERRPTLKSTLPVESLLSTYLPQTTRRGEGEALAPTKRGFEPKRAVLSPLLEVQSVNFNSAGYTLYRTASCSPFEAAERDAFSSSRSVEAFRDRVWSFFESGGTRHRFLDFFRVLRLTPQFFT